MTIGSEAKTFFMLPKYWSSVKDINFLYARQMKCDICFIFWMNQIIFFTFIGGSRSSNAFIILGSTSLLEYECRRACIYACILDKWDAPHLIS